EDAALTIWEEFMLTFTNHFLPLELREAKDDEFMAQFYSTSLPCFGDAFHNEGQNATIYIWPWEAHSRQMCYDPTSQGNGYGLIDGLCPVDQTQEVGK
ncbi:hypothetical protein HAX54_000282, partial [Datura stramonium]|nr:hypothetical protein [Datura stramonium]